MNCFYGIVQIADSQTSIYTKFPSRNDNIHHSKLSTKMLKRESKKRGGGGGGQVVWLLIIGADHKICLLQSFRYRAVDRKLKKVEIFYFYCKLLSVTFAAL